MCLYPYTPIGKALPSRSVTPASCQLLTASQDANSDGLNRPSPAPRPGHNRRKHSLVADGDLMPAECIKVHFQREKRTSSQ